MSSNNQNGFTLIEMLIVLAILGVLAGIVSLAVASLSSEAVETGANAELEIVQKAVVAAMVMGEMSTTAPEECVDDFGATDLDIWPAYVKRRYPGGGRSYSWDSEGNVSFCDDSVPRIEASYWDNRQLSGEPKVQRIEEEINHDWGYDTPDPLIPVNQFSARWRWPIEISQPGMYQFTATSDDGVRLYLDGTLILDYWVWQSATSHSTQVAIPAGSHELIMEYFEGNGHAVAKLDWGYVESEP